MIVTESQLRNYLRFKCKEAGSCAAWAKSKKLHPQQVSEVINGRRPFTVPTLKALKAKEVKNYKMPEMHFEDIG